MVTVNQLTRNQIASFAGNDPEVIRAIERLFAVAGQSLPEEVAQLIVEVAYLLGQATDQEYISGVINDMVMSLIQNSLKLDFLDLNPAPPVAGKTRRIWWSEADQTANIGMEYDVTQQVGQEVYARVGNTTGVTIPNGSVVGFAGATSDALLVEPFIADGSHPSLYILGVMTHDLPDSGQKGYCTTFGFVRNLNTSAFSPGDILYASPTTPGALTKVKPTAPNNVVPVAACIVSDAADGMIFVRPTIEQQRNYGVFSDTVSMTPAAIYTPYQITFNTTDFSRGFSRGTPTSRIVASQAGLYNFQFSAQLTSSSSSAKKIWIWPRINGVDVPNSNSEVSVSANGQAAVVAWNWVLSINVNDYFEIVYAVDDITLTIVAAPAQTGAVGTASFARPSVPSIILTVTQVQQ